MGRSSQTAGKPRAAAARGPRRKSTLKITGSEFSQGQIKYEEWIPRKFKPGSIPKANGNKAGKQIPNKKVKKIDDYFSIILNPEHGSRTMT